VASSIDALKPSERLARREVKLAERWKEAYAYQNGGGDGPTDDWGWGWLVPQFVSYSDLV